MTWSIPTREEAEAYTQAYLAAQEAYFEESIDNCINCINYETCPCGKTGHEKGISIGYSIGECKDYKES